MRIHAIQTGTVAVKTRQREGVGRGAARLLNTLRDREWTRPLPILAWAIEHPEGVIVVDTGESARASEPGYFPRWHPYFRSGVREWVQPGEEIGPRLAELGIGCEDVRWVVLTHLHTDHAGGLHHFPRSEVLVSRRELEAASGRRGRLRGYPNDRWPSWLDPRVVQFQPLPFGPFPDTLPLTAAGDVRLVSTPGHSPGHLSVVVEEEGRVVLLAGDASYTEELMLRDAIDGVAPDGAAARRTIERLCELVRSAPTVYLPSHDPESGRRLAERSIAAPARAQEAGQGGRELKTLL